MQATNTTATAAITFEVQADTIAAAHTYANSTIALLETGKIHGFSKVWKENAVVGILATRFDIPDETAIRIVIDAKTANAAARAAQRAAKKDGKPDAVQAESVASKRYNAAMRHVQRLVAEHTEKTPAQVEAAKAKAKAKAEAEAANAEVDADTVVSIKTAAQAQKHVRLMAATALAFAEKYAALLSDDQRDVIRDYHESIMNSLDASK
jgi:spore cortex formation protein SpoVR/YcgB (stage V sporulation)